MKMKSRIPSDKVLDAYKTIAKDIVDPSTTFVLKTVDGKTRILAEKPTTGNTMPTNFKNQ